MKLALIPPISLLEYTDETHTQLMLPQLIYSDAYTYVYNKHCEDPDQYVILDNGANEGEDIDPFKLLEIAYDFGVDEIIVPDVIGSHLETVRKLESFITLIMDNKIPLSMKLMFVAQGQTLVEAKASIERAMQFAHVRTIALPRHLATTTKVVNARHLLAAWFANKYEGQGASLHLLGGDPGYPTEIADFKHVWPAIVRSHDTSAPFNFAHANKVLARGNKVKRPRNYFDLPAMAFEENILRKNIDLLKEWTGD